MSDEFKRNSLENSSSNQTQPRRDWQDSRVRDKIRSQCEDPGTAIAVYVALTAIASEEASEEFQTTHQWIASIAGFSERTVWARIQDLERIGVISVTTPALKAPCTYRLLDFENVRRLRTFRNHCGTFRNETVIPLRNVPQPLRGSGSLKSSKGTQSFKALSTSGSQEEEYMERLKQFLGEAASENDGGKWRKRFRKKAEDCWRVLATAEEDLKGRRQIRSRPAYLEDLWKRLVVETSDKPSGDWPKPKPKQPKLAVSKAPDEPGPSDPKEFLRNIENGT